MSKRKRRRGFFDFSDLFDFGFDEEMLFEHGPAEGGSGYSISVTYDDKGKPLVKVETYGDIDAAELRREIERQYPGAKIEGLEKQPLIRVVDEKSSEAEESKSESKGKNRKERRRKVHQ
jgi:hypothetical protein